MDLYEYYNFLRVSIILPAMHARCLPHILSLCRHSINALSFSHDGEYIAIASQGSYIDIVSGTITVSEQISDVYNLFSALRKQAYQHTGYRQSDHLQLSPGTPRNMS